MPALGRRTDPLLPLTSLLRKCEKASLRVGAGTWQSRMLLDHVAALRLGIALLSGSARFSSAELRGGLAACEAMLAKAVLARGKFAPGTAQHSLQANRIAALRAARQAMARALDQQQGP